jgi:hypothetical protein
LLVCVGALRFPDLIVHSPSECTRILNINFSDGLSPPSVREQETIRAAPFGPFRRGALLRGEINDSGD